jgi:Hint domain
VSWIGLNDRQIARFDARGIAPEGVGAGAAGAGAAGSQPRAALPENALPEDAMLCQGSLVVETCFDPTCKQPQILVSLARDLPWPCRIALQISGTGQLCWLHRQGSVSSKGALDLNLLTQPDRLRISYNWDAPARSAWLTVLDLDSGQALTTRVAHPAPLLLRDLARILLNPASLQGQCAATGHPGETPAECMDNQTGRPATGAATSHTELHSDGHSASHSGTRTDRLQQPHPRCHTAHHTGLHVGQLPEPQPDQPPGPRAEPHPEPHVEPHSEPHLGPGLRLIALSDRPEPTLMVPTLCGDTLIDTEFGPRPVQDLRPGDLICLAGGDIAPLRALITQQLPACGWFAPVELRAPFFGLHQSILVAQDHHLLLTGPDADYLFGESHLLVKARHLQHHNGARLCPGLLQTMYQLLFDNHTCVQAGGIGSESLFAGQIAAQPALLARSTLAQMPAARMPRHKCRFRPVLGRFEAETLIRATSV